MTDLHLTHKNLRNRFDYTKETRKALAQLYQVINKYKEQEMKVVLIFLGDIFHNAYDVVFDAIIANNTMIAIQAAVDGMFSVIGNHELTYYIGNPFWSLMTSVPSVRARRIMTDLKKPRGILDILEVPDRVECGDVRFIFNHYGCGVDIVEDDGKKNIGLFHQDLYTKEVVQDVLNERGVEVFEHTPVYLDTAPFLKNYHYAFFGHAHLFYSEWMYVCAMSTWETIICYLSTLGRTSHAEVQDNFLERDIPAIIVKEGKMVAREYNKFNLLKRSDCVKEALVKIQVEKDKDLRERKKVGDNVARSDNPLESLKAAKHNDPVALHLIEQTLSRGVSELEMNILAEARSVV